MIKYFVQYLKAIGYQKPSKLFPLVSITLLISMLELCNVGLIFPIIQAFVNADHFQSSIFVKIVREWTPFQNIQAITIFFIVSFLLLTLIRGFISFIGYKRITKQISRDEADFAAQQFSNLLAKDFLYFSATPSSKLIRDIAISIPMGYSTALQSIVIILSESFILLGICAYLLLISVKIFALVSTTFALSGLLYLRIVSPKITELGKKRHESSHKTIGVIQQSLEGIAQIKNWQSENFFQSLFYKEREKQAHITASLNAMQNLPRVYFETILMVSISVFLAYSVLNATNPHMFLSVVGFYIVSALRLLPSILRLSIQTNTLISVKPSIEIILNAASMFENCLSPVQSMVPHRFDSSLSFQNVSFSYETEQVVENLSFHLKKGSVIGITGRSGQGKTTFVNILVGLLTPSSGYIVLDGKRIKDSEQSNLLSMIAYVPQSIFLLDDTIKKNVAFGLHDSEIDEKKVCWALCQAQLNDFVDSLDDGINTSVGERGSRLSGGQKQRLGIARAFYFDREIIIFDEATASLDAETESGFCNTLESYKDQKTIILISHRTRPLSICNQVYEMKSGNLIEKRIYEHL